jgi:hypothetical protein
MGRWRIGRLDCPCGGGVMDRLGSDHPETTKSSKKSLAGLTNTATRSATLAGSTKESGET